MIKKILIAVGTLLMSTAVMAMPDVSFTNTFDTGGVVIEYKIKDDKISYQIIRNGNRQQFARDVAMESREMFEGVWIVQMHNPTFNILVTMVFDFNTDRSHESGGIQYGNEGQFVYFWSGTLSDVSWAGE